MIISAHPKETNTTSSHMTHVMMTRCNQTVHCSFIPSIFPPGYQGGYDDVVMVDISIPSPPPLPPCIPSCVSAGCGNPPLPFVSPQVFLNILNTTEPPALHQSEDREQSPARSDQWEEGM